jgi:hypothetical protein
MAFQFDIKTLNATRFHLKRRVQDNIWPSKHRRIEELGTLSNEDYHDNMGHLVVSA